ncbi:MAG: hypothetical protein HY560_01375 [Gemmatimonadetes bacterium]|nr:hypothetical protein [Gemmatimonadota bacterium]
MLPRISLVAILAACALETQVPETQEPPRPPPPPPPPEQQLAPPECASPRPAWIWCDDFEQDRLSRYFEHDGRGGSFTRDSGAGHGGSVGMRARYVLGQVAAGSLHLAFGKTPQSYFRPVDVGTTVYREIYWRLYLKHQPGWGGGGGDKLTRAISFASPTSWAEAMIAHVWSSSGSSRDYLVIDPASGTDTLGNLITTTYNDFAKLRWLGAARGHTPLFDAAHVGRWYCIETHVRLNTLGLSDGVFELWIDGETEARRTGLNWLGLFATYGINALFFENHWDAGAPQPQERYFDHLVVSTERIGCLP